MDNEKTLFDLAGLCYITSSVVESTVSIPSNDSSDRINAVVLNSVIKSCTEERGR